jgi:extracellular elastinolytic metalloproteinase
MAQERDPHGEYCSKLQQELHFGGSMRSQQVTLNTPEQSTAELLRALHQSNCGSRDFTSSSAIHDVEDFSNKPALLAFMMHATPSESVASDINDNFFSHIDKMYSAFESSFVGDHSVTVEHIHNVPDTVRPVKARAAYIQVPEGDKTVLQPVWKFEVEMQDNWYEASVSVNKPYRVISVVDWASDAYAPIPRKEESKLPTYNVFKWGINDPSEGNRSTVSEKPDILASPAGWHALPFENDPQYFGVRRAAGAAKFRNTTSTWGNNVFAHENWEGRNSWVDNYRPDAGASLNFSYAYDPRETGSEDALREAKGYINATVTQLFYTSNMVHDLFYRYGFDEVSGNFQQHNFGRGGEENDAVIANAQDGSGFNNANFMVST